MKSKAGTFIVFTGRIETDENRQLILIDEMDEIFKMPKDTLKL
jgi:hypothetical protein